MTALIKTCYQLVEKVCSCQSRVLPLGLRRLALLAALRHVFIQHLVRLNEVFLHGRHLSHYLLSVEFSRLCLPLPLGFLLVLYALEFTPKYQTI